MGVITVLFLGPGWLLSEGPAGTFTTTVNSLPLVAPTMFLVGIGLGYFYDAVRLRLFGLFLLLTYGYGFVPVMLESVGWESFFGASFGESQILLPVLVPLTFLGIHFWGEIEFTPWPTVEKPFILLAELGLLAFFYPSVADGVLTGREVLPDVDGFYQPLMGPGLVVVFSLIVLAVLVLVGHCDYDSRYVSLNFWIIITVCFSFTGGFQWNYGSLPYHHALFFAGAGLLYDVQALSFVRVKGLLNSFPGRFGWINDTVGWLVRLPARVDYTKYYGQVKQPISNLYDRLSFDLEQYQDDVHDSVVEWFYTSPDHSLGESTIHRLRDVTFFLIPALVPAGVIALVVSGPMTVLEMIPAGTLGTWMRVLPFLAPGVLLVGIGLCVYFNSSRLSLMGLFLLFVYGYVYLPEILRFLRGESFLGPSFFNSQIVFPVLIPLTFIGIHFTDESGIVSVAGIIKAGVLFLEVIGLALIFPYVSESVYRGLGYVPQLRILNGAVNVPFLTLSLSLVALMTFVVFRERNYYSNYISLIFWILLTASLSFSAGVNWTYEGRSYHHTLFFLGVGLLYDLKVTNFLWSKVYRDQLTQIPGRMALDEYLQGLSGHYSICMIDIDHFKDFNDTYGHDAGDKVLKTVADTIQSNTRGRAYRFGGEEFTVIYNGRGIDDVKDELENLREAVASNKVKVTRKSKRATKLLERKVTISLGLAENTRDFNGPGEVLNAADNALFEAKEEGRNMLIEH